MGIMGEFTFVSDHNDIVNVPIHITLAKAVELDLVFTIDIHPETILSIKVERTIGAISVIPGALEIDAQELAWTMSDGKVIENDR